MPVSVLPCHTSFPLHNHLSLSLCFCILSVLFPSIWGYTAPGKPLDTVPVTYSACPWCMLYSVEPFTYDYRTPMICSSVCRTFNTFSVPVSILQPKESGHASPSCVSRCTVLAASFIHMLGSIDTRCTCVRIKKSDMYDMTTMRLQIVLYLGSYQAMQRGELFSC